MKVMSLSEFKAVCKQHWKSYMDIEYVCPRCKTVQNGHDLVAAGAGASAEEIDRYLGFSCVGRWSKEKGCDWTLGGLFQIHKLELMLDDGSAKMPCFELNLPKESEAGNVSE